MKKRRYTNRLVTVVPWGDGRWGVAGTLNGGRSHIAYVVGSREKAQAEALRLKNNARNFKPEEDTVQLVEIWRGTSAS
jgi:hypothetical protein